MTRLHTINPAAASGDLGQTFKTIQQAIGRVPNAYATIGSQSLPALQGLLAADQVIRQGTLSPVEVETVRLVVSELAGCDYCVAAHTLIGKQAGLSTAQTQQLRQGDSCGVPKLDALAEFVRTLQQSEGTLEATGLARLLGAGFTEQQVVEIAYVMSAITFTNLVNRINDTVVDFPPVN